jgi:internalin A
MTDHERAVVCFLIHSVLGSSHALCFRAAPAKVCTCYAREDDHLREELHAHMAPMERLGVIQSWYDGKITPGSDWKGQIDEHLREADFILLLISAAFIKSEYCYEIEMKFALERHNAGSVVVIPSYIK